MNSQKCKICDSPTTIIHDAPFSTDYFYCSVCHFIAMDEAKILTPEKERQRYLQHINTPDDQGYVTLLNLFLEKTVHPFQKPGGNALDFGSGPGPVLATLLQNLGYSIDLYDPYFSPDEIDLNKSYRLITCTEVIEHIKNPLPTINSLKNLLEPGGLLAISTRFHPVSSDTDDSAFQQWWYRRDATHISFFRHETFDYISEKQGWKILFRDDKDLITLQKPIF